MLPSNKSNPWGSLKNLTNIIDLLAFPISLPLKVIGKKTLLFHVCHLNQSWVIFSQKFKVTPKGYKIAPPTNTSYDVPCVTIVWAHIMV
jgi:hypothetical protein